MDMDYEAELEGNRNDGRSRIRRAKIVKIEYERFITYITVTYRDNSVGDGGRNQKRLVAIVSKDTKILDEDNNEIRARELRKGMIVNLTVSNNLIGNNPPVTYAYRVVIKKDVEETLKSEGYVLYVENQNDTVAVLEFNEDQSYDLTNFKVTDQTKIFNSNGRPIELNRLRRGMKVEVEHSAFQTASFPPIAVAYEIRVK